MNPFYFKSNGFIYVVDAHFIDKIEENKYPGPSACDCAITIMKSRAQCTVGFPLNIYLHLSMKEIIFSSEIDI